MAKNFCLTITLMVAVLFMFSCSQQEKAEVEQSVSEKRETIPEDTSGMDEHAAHTPTEKRETTSEDTMPGMDEHADHAAMVASSDAAKTIRFWTCVMHPTVKMPEPGSCPVCKMDLIPIYEGSGLELTEQQKALIPVRTEPVAFREVSREIRTRVSGFWIITKHGWLMHQHEFLGGLKTYILILRVSKYVRGTNSCLSIARSWSRHKKNI